jgi:hypothetical protein
MPLYLSNFGIPFIYLALGDEWEVEELLDCSPSRRDFYPAEGDHVIEEAVWKPADFEERP